MTTNYHTPIAVGAAANAATFNTPLGDLDDEIGNRLATSGTTTGATTQAQSFDMGIAVPGDTDQDPLTLGVHVGSFLGVSDPIFEVGFNVEDGDWRTADVAAVWLAMEGNYANDTYQATERNYSEFYVAAKDAAGQTFRPLAFTWDNGDFHNYVSGHLYVSSTRAFNIIRAVDGEALYTFSGNGVATYMLGLNFSASNCYIQATANTPLTLVANSHQVKISNTLDGLLLGSVGDTKIYRSAANTLKTDGALNMQEMTAPSAPSENNVLIFAVDNGAGKTKLMAQFATGDAVQIAIEP